MTLFSNQLRETGRIAEERAISLLQARGASIEDVREKPYWQSQDVDFVAKYGARLVKTEVKYDRHISRTSNFNFELFRLYCGSPVRAGWSEFSQAEEFLIWAPDTQVFYGFNTKTLRAAKDQYVLATRPNTPLRTISSDALTTTINLLLPLAVIPTYSVWVNPNKWERVK